MKLSMVNFIKRGYGDFKANDQGKTPIQDGSASCGAGLIFYRQGKQIYDTTGKTGSKVAGHAEMVALSYLIQHLYSQGHSYADIARDFLSGNYEIELTCEGKSCCVQCSIILGILKVVAFDFSTTKCKKTMLGGGAWGLPANVRTLVNEILIISDEYIVDIEFNDFANSYTQTYGNVL